MTFDEYTKTKIDPYLAECYLHLNDYTTAFDLLNDLIGQKGIDDETAFYGNLIYCCLQTGKEIKAIHLLTDAINLHPSGILEYLNSLHNQKKYQAETDIGDEKIINCDELIRKILINQTRNN